MPQQNDIKFKLSSGQLVCPVLNVTNVCHSAKCHFAECRGAKKSHSEKLQKKNKKSMHYSLGIALVTLTNNHIGTIEIVVNSRRRKY